MDDKIKKLIEDKSLVLTKEQMDKIMNRKFVFTSHGMTEVREGEEELEENKDEENNYLNIPFKRNWGTIWSAVGAISGIVALVVAIIAIYLQLKEG